MTNRPPLTFATETSVVAGNSAFALDLYGRLKSSDGNLFFSPYSISTCLAIAYAGARNETETQIARALHFDTSQEEFHIVFGDLQRQINAIQQKKNVELNIANGLWAQKGHPFLAPFLETATRNYDAKAEQVDFTSAAETVRQEINDWVSDRTHSRIKDLIPPKTLHALTRMVLVNAIYFKGKWQKPFQEKLTESAPFFLTRPASFFLTGNKRVPASLMHMAAHFKYAETENLQLLELSYAGRDVSMVVLLPKEKYGLKALEDSLTATQLQSWLKQARSREVNVYLPKFKMTQQFALAQTLAAMGMNDAFSSRADFSGMDGTKDLGIAEVIHKAFVEVNEEGTEAAAATGLTVVLGMMIEQPEPVPVFRADHPFLFFIRDTRSGTILFMGRVTDPTK